MICATSPFFPLLADIYYPIVEQGGYGNVQKTWVFDRQISCYFESGSKSSKDDIQPKIKIIESDILSGRVGQDIRISSNEDGVSLTNIVITNIKNSSGVELYTETAGVRAGSSTIFEIASYDPFIGPFGDIEYYSVVIRRSENQSVDA